MANLVSIGSTIKRSFLRGLVVALMVLALSLEGNILKGSLFANIGWLTFLRGQASDNEVQLEQSANWFHQAALYSPVTVSTQMGLILTNECLGGKQSVGATGRMNLQIEQTILERLWAFADRDTKLGKPSKALRWYQIALKLFPDSPYAAIQLAKMQINLHQVDEALVLLDRAVQAPQLQADPLGLADAYVTIGWGLETRGDYTGAISALEMALAVNPDHYDALFRLGALQYYMRDLESAEETLMHALRVRPTSPWALLYLGLVYSEQQRYTEAERAFLDGLKYDPNRVELLESLVNLYLAWDKPQLASGYFERVLATGRTVPGYYRRLGQAYERIGDVNAALWAYRQALSIDPTDEVSGQRIRELTR